MGEIRIKYIVPPYGDIWVNSWLKTRETLRRATTWVRFRILQNMAQKYHKDAIIMVCSSLVGERFGKLLVAEMLPGYKGGRTYLRCKCDCGNETIVMMSNVKRGMTRSCGCYEKASRFNRDNHYKNLLGIRFGHLTVVSKGDKHYRSGCISWNCVCDCGNKIEVSSAHLLRGKTRSCGCNRRSKYEEFVQGILDKYNVKYYQEYSFERCKNKFPLKFDFFLPEHNVCIECQGQQHYHPVPFFGGEERFSTVKTNDQIKADFCKMQNIILLCLPYTITDTEAEKQICNILFPCND